MNKKQEDFLFAKLFIGITIILFLIGVFFFDPTRPKIIPGISGALGCLGMLILIKSMVD